MGIVTVLSDANVIGRFARGFLGSKLRRPRGGSARERIPQESALSSQDTGHCDHFTPVLEIDLFKK